MPRSVAQKMDTAQASETLLPELLPCGKGRDSPAGWEGAGSRAMGIPRGPRRRAGLGRAWVVRLRLIPQHLLSR